MIRAARGRRTPVARAARTRRRVVAAAAVGALAVAGVIAAVVSTVRPAPSAVVATAATTAERAAERIPDLEFADFRTGQPRRLHGFLGRPLVINFFASWCAPCLNELPRFEATYRRYRDQVEFLGLNLQDPPGDAAEVVQWAGLSYPIGVDPDGRLFQALGGFGMPTTLFVAPDGTLLERFTGELSAEQLLERLRTYGMIAPEAAS